MPEGGTQRQMLEAVQKKIGKPLPELQTTNVPFCLEHIWEFLKDMMVSRQYINGNPIPLSATEVQAWCGINDLKLSPWEARALRQMDVGFLEGLRS